jgi:hypothetical protein
VGSLVDSSTVRTIRSISKPASLAMALTTIVGLGLAAGCAREAKPAAPPAQPADEPPPPLPPASGTPIGYLIDDPRVQLNDDQRTKLKAIDDDLMGQLSYLDSVMRNAGPTTAQPQGDNSRGGVGFSASGERNNSDAQRVQGGSSGGGNASLPPEVLADNAATVKRIPEVRAHDVRKAIAQALAVLDTNQQKVARQVLVEHGVDPDTGQFEAKGEPGTIRPEPPK